MEHGFELPRGPDEVQPLNGHGGPVTDAFPERHRCIGVTLHDRDDIQLGHQLITANTELLGDLARVHGLSRDAGEVDQVGVATHGLDHAVLGHPHRRRRRAPASFLELLVDLGGIVDAEDDHVARPRTVERLASRVHLVEHDLHRAGAGVTLVDGFPDPFHHEVRRLSRLASARVAVLPDDLTDVEMASGDPPQLPHVLVTPVARGRHDSDDEVGIARRLPRPLGARAVGREAIDEVPQSLEPGRVVGVIEDHLDAVHLEGDAAGFRALRVEQFPMMRDNGKSVRVVVGPAYGARSPVTTTSETLFADAHLKAGSTLPLDADHEERAIYVLDGEIDIAGDTSAATACWCSSPATASPSARSPTRTSRSFGGATMDGPRHIWWNFVSSRKDRIEQAKAEWTAGHFDKVPGDEIEFIPLPAK